MDLVAITDHDSIDGALELLERLPGRADVIVGEEVSCWLPDGDVEVHLGVYGMTEALHRELQPLRRNVFDVVALPAGSGRVLCAQSPAASSIAARRALDAVPAAARRGAGARSAKRHDAAPRTTALVGADRGGAGIAPTTGRGWPWLPAATRTRCGASGTTWTEAPGRDREEFLSSLHERPRTPRRRHGGAHRCRGRCLRGHPPLRREPRRVSGRRDHRGWRRAACLAFAVGVAAVPVPAPRDCGRRARCAKRRKSSRSRDS